MGCGLQVGESVGKRRKAVKEAYWDWISDSILSRRFTFA
jgi:hypothetical protein